MIVSPLTTKAQATIAYRIQEGHVILTRAMRDVVDDPFAAFNEWESKTDRQSYGEL